MATWMNETQVQLYLDAHIHQIRALSKPGAKPFWMSDAFKNISANEMQAGVDKITNLLEVKENASMLKRLAAKDAFYMAALDAVIQLVPLESQKSSLKAAKLKLQ